MVSRTGSPITSAEAATTASPRPARPQQAADSPAERSGWPFVVPAVLLLLVLNVFPLVFSLGMSFSNVSTENGLRLTSATLGNWGQLLHDSDFWSSLSFTFFFVALAVAGEFLCGLTLALLLWRRIPGGGVLRVVFTIPMMVAPVAIGFIFRMIFNEQYGPVDSILRGLHLPNVLWLSSTGTAPWTVVIMDIWQWTPLMFLLLLAGLQSIPEDAIEAARIDGATDFLVIRDIVLPLLGPISAMAVFLRMILAFTIFGQIYLLTGGGPGTSTTSTTLFAYYQGFQNFNLSFGSTISLALLIFVSATGLTYLTVTRRLLRRVAT